MLERISERQLKNNMHGEVLLATDLGSSTCSLKIQQCTLSDG